MKESFFLASIDVSHFAPHDENYPFSFLLQLGTLYYYFYHYYFSFHLNRRTQREIVVGTTQVIFVKFFSTPLHTDGSVSTIASFYIKIAREKVKILKTLFQLWCSVVRDLILFFLWARRFKRVMRKNVVSISVCSIIAVHC